MVGWLAQESGPIQARFGSGENLALWLIFGVSLVALLFAWYLVREVLAAPEGTEKMKEIARAIQEGAKAYLNRQYRTLAVFLAVLAVVLFFVLPVPKNAEHSAHQHPARAVDRVPARRARVDGHRVRGDVARRARERPDRERRARDGPPACRPDRVPRRRGRRDVHGRAWGCSARR